MHTHSRHVPRSAPRHACALTRPLQLMLALLLIACTCAVPILASAPDRHSDDQATRTVAGDASRSGDDSASTRGMSAQARDESRGRADAADDDDTVTDYDYYYGDAENDGYAEYGESDEVEWGDDEHAYDSVDVDAASVWTGSGDAGDVGDDEELVLGWAVGHGCHSCKCLPPCKSQRCNIVRPCTTKRCTGHCKWPKRSKRGRPLGACRLGNCSRFNPGLATDMLAGLEVASEESPP